MRLLHTADGLESGFAGVECSSYSFLESDLILTLSKTHPILLPSISTICKPDGDAVLPFPPEIDPASMPAPLDADEEELNKYLASRLSGLCCFTPECITR
jgi:hypothetical protein